MPTVRIITPTYRRADIVGEAIANALAQTFTDFEIVVADDGSDDGTEVVVADWCRRDPRVRFTRVPHRGAAWARNAGIELTGSFKYVAFLDSDDLWPATHLETAVRVMDAVPDVSLFCGRCETVDPQGFMTAEQRAARDAKERQVAAFGEPIGANVYKITGRRFISAHVRSEFTPLTSTVVARASHVPAGPWFGPLAFMEDCDFFIRAAEGHAVAFHDDIHCQLRLRGDNTTVARDLRSPRVLDKCRSQMTFTIGKLRHCETAADRAVVRRQIADIAYLTGQCCAEQDHFAEARRAYLTALRHAPSLLAAKSLAGASLPSSVKRTASRIVLGTRG